MFNVPMRPVRAGNSARSYAHAATRLRCLPQRRLVACVALCFAATASGHDDVPPPPAAELAASTVVVQNCNDSGPGSLRAAYANAVDNETIDLSQLVCSRITLGSGLVDPVAAANVTLKGPGRDQLAIDGSGLYRVLEHRGNGYLSVDQLTITNGYYRGDLGGGCIRSNGSVEATASTISGCRLESVNNTTPTGGAIYAREIARLSGSTVADGGMNEFGGRSSRGGGIYAAGVILSASTVSGNSSTLGGGIFAAGGVIDIGNSTLSGNHANYGGALYARGSSGMIANSTISGNEAAYSGGGIYVYNPLDIFNCTVAGNYAGRSGAGLYFYALTGLSTLRSTILGNNTLTGGLVEADLAGGPDAVISGADNLIMASTLALPAGTITVDPKLGPLQDNGGPTLTHALLPGSPAIGRGSNVLVVENDQRGAPFKRVDGSRADIGAFEFAETLFKGDFESAP